MALWGKNNTPKKEIDESERLVKQLEKLEGETQAILEKWEKDNMENVFPLAERVSVLSLMRDPQGLIEAHRDLQRACWDRDRAREAHQRKIEGLCGDLEALTGPVINEKAMEWQQGLFQLREKKSIEKVRARETVGSGTMITFRSNFGAIASAKEKLIKSRTVLRAMTHRPLSEIHSFIGKVEAELNKVDFSELKEESNEISERDFKELCETPGVEIVVQKTNLFHFGGEIHEISKTTEVLNKHNF